MFEESFLNINEKVRLDLPHGIELSVKREDLIHPTIPGNKFRKLKYNVLAAKAMGCTVLVTFGGAYSNHIAAVAELGAVAGFSTVGYIRGEELFDKISENPTLQKAQSLGMKFQFLTRRAYRKKDENSFVESIKRSFPNSYLIPEGGTNELAVKGCGEIIGLKDKIYDYICVAVGTGGTMSGIVQAGMPGQKILGFPAVKGSFLKTEIDKWVKGKANWDLIEDYVFGGYAKINPELIAFINRFKAETKIALDPIYTGKMMFGILDLIKKGFFKENSKILAIHTGGLQGVSGMNVKLKQKGWPLIE
ncbi:pyridoxal-phosphate dependent enzyme [Flavobacteriaceae bacterium F08102]|nr:pyridoxal-phosphate dependent enzyme [Flavobacteriaceae bacterium F08102]